MTNLNNVNSKCLFENLLSQPASTIQTFLDSVIENKSQIPNDFNWLGLAEYAGQRLKESIDWYILAVRLYDFVSAQQIESEKLGLDQSRMLLRIRGITLYGDCLSCSSVESEIIIWAKKTLPNIERLSKSLLDYNKARKDYNNFDCWIKSNINLIREMRKAKNILRVINELAKISVLPQCLEKYLELMHDLP